MAAMRKEFFSHTWFLFELGITLIGIIDIILRETDTISYNFDLSETVVFMNIVRLLRVPRILKVKRKSRTWLWFPLWAWCKNVSLKSVQRFQRKHLLVGWCQDITSQIFKYSNYIINPFCSWNYTHLSQFFHLIEKAFLKIHVYVNPSVV